MRLVLIGCEYSGTTTLGWAISKWTVRVLGSFMGFHDHWKIPHVAHPEYESQEEADAAYQAWEEGKADDPTRQGFDDEEQRLFLALKPNQHELFQRYDMEYHLSPAFYASDNHNVVGMHIDEAVYAPLYYGYGGEGEYDRKRIARHVEETMIKMAPETVLVLCQASPDVIRSRMRENPHHNGLVKDKDVELLLGRFEEEYELSLIKNKFTVDTGSQTVDESLAEFLGKYDEHLSDANRLKMLVHKAKQQGNWG